MQLLAGLVILLDELARPIYRPLLRLVASLALVRRLEALVARQERAVVLLCLAVPFAIAEPLKLVALLLLARGGFRSGIVMLGLAHLLSFLLVERVYHAGREKLRSYRWLARGVDGLAALRAALMQRLRRSGAYAAIRRIRRRLRLWLAVRRNP